MATTSIRLTTLVVLFSAAGSAQTAPLRVDVNLVLVPVTVTDRSGRFLTGLDRSRFKVLEDGIPQPIASFSTEELPVSIGLVLDVSGSMKQKLDTARSFVRALLDGAETSDESLLLTCADRPDLQIDLTTDSGRLGSVLQGARSQGRTALIDSVYQTIDRMKSAHHTRKVLVVVSDGQDNYSRHTRSELISKAIESEAQIYAVATPDAPGFQKAIELTEASRGMALLSDLANATGGMLFSLESYTSVASAAERITRTMHDQYLIGYYPVSAQRPGTPHRIQIKLDLPDVRLYAKSRYYPAL
jgi:Ca-activated chloride channel family protein